MIAATGYAIFGAEPIDAEAVEQALAPPGHYFIEGVGFLPRVSMILDQLAKPGLEKWKLNQLRDLYLKAAESLSPSDSRPLAPRFRQEVARLGAVAARQKSPATLGTRFHAFAEWRSKGMMGLDPGPQPSIPTEIEPAIQAWEAWVVGVQFRPILVEHRAWCTDDGCFYAGTLDSVAEVEGQVTLLDWKRSRDIYSTYLAQISAYDHLLTRSTGLVADRAAIIRLPQAVPGPVEMRSVGRAELAEHRAAFQALLTLWRWARDVVEGQADRQASARRQTYSRPTLLPSSAYPLATPFVGVSL